MTDCYATISEVDPIIQERLVDVLEMRAADPQQRDMLESYLSRIDFPKDTEALEVGCGTGAITRTLAQWPGVANAIGVDPSPIFIAKARELGREVSNLSFREGDGRSLSFEDQSFDVVVFHTTMCHVPGPEDLLAEAFRVLRGNGWLAVFDGDYVTATVATGNFDPLESCIGAFRDAYCNDQWIVRRLPTLIQSSGFSIMPMQSHGYVESPKGGYMLTWVDR